MNIIGVIPARFGSTRFKGKPLKPILGKPMIQWVIEAALKSKSLSQVMVATDHDEIKAVAEKMGVKAVMTDPELPSGSDRVWAAIKDVNCDGVINIQGDEPLLDPTALDQLASGLKQPEVSMATLAEEFGSKEALSNPNFAKIVVNQRSEAIYFSRFAIPFTRLAPTNDAAYCLKHIGLYGYRKNFLEAFCKTPPTAIEIAEGLEQLRALWLGAKIKVILTKCESWGVDSPEDVIRVEEILKTRGS